MIVLMRLVPALLLGILTTIAPVRAQDYPARPVRIVIPYPPGGASDVTARLLAQKLGEFWGQQVIADNRPGANGIVALEHVAKQPADGYTLLMANLGPNAINPAVYAKLPYDPIKDFTPITLTTMVPQVLVAAPNLEARTLKEVIDFARANPGKLSYGNGGNGSANHLGVELMAALAGVSFTAIPYKGDAPAMLDTMSGQLAMTLPTVVAATPHIRAGKLRALAVSTRTRVASLPEVPTMQEAGVANYESSSWGGVMAPGATPSPIVAKVHADLVRALRLPDIQERLGGLGATVLAQGPAEFTTFLAAEIRKWDGVAKRANIRLE
ncbi:MAG: tripartite tricarboxylate transporter substrate binding protein [Burkholderiales bacterium]|nr:tripartite tricarboxylate transporter substrate binding protein [Burkholderiales bacterium]